MARSVAGHFFILIIVFLALPIQGLLQVVEILSILPQKEDHPPRQSRGDHCDQRQGTPVETGQQSGIHRFLLSTTATIIPLAANQRSIFGLDLWPGSLGIWPTTAKSIILDPPEHN
jgi:hypothetical protein